MEKVLAVVPIAQSCVSGGLGQRQEAVRLSVGAGMVGVAPSHTRIQNRRAIGVNIKREEK